jgi:NADPH-dependent glutamate synthase beta subunit-like oxidoreductase
VAIVGGGPTGIAATVRLVEFGHTVALFERSNRLGGTPDQVIPASRLPDLQPEIDALLHPAIAAERLRIHTGTTFGADLTLEHLRTHHDAVLLTTGLWQEQSLGRADGVMDALSFLAQAKSGHAGPLPDRVALLAGGDSAMDAARMLQSSGAQEIYVLFGGPRSALHWHMPESWWATPGVHAMMDWQATGYETDASGHLCGVRIRHTELYQECVLAVGLVIEAMGLQVVDALRAALTGVHLPGFGCGPRTNVDRLYAAGALVNGGASVAQCVAEGLAAAAAIHDDLTG